MRHRRCDLPVETYSCGSSFEYGTTTDDGYGYGYGGIGYGGYTPFNGDRDGTTLPDND